MPTFAVAASLETIERANKVMELYYQEGDKKEDTLIRILDLAESESIKGTHPELEGALKSVDATIGTLIKQINGIVAGQDSRITELTGKLNAAIEGKRTALETAKAQTEAAASKMETAEAAIKKAETDIELAKTQAQAEIASAQKDAAISIDNALSERDQAIRERNDARTIAEEKTASNDLLIRQMSALETDAAAYKALQKEHHQLSTDYSSVQRKLTEKERELADVKKDAETAQKALQADFNRQMELSKAQADLTTEKAVNAAEKTMREQIHQADKENAKLAVQIELLQGQIDRLQEQIAQLTATPKAE